MYITRYILKFILFILFTPLAIQTIVPAQDTYVRNHDVQNTLRSLDENQPQENRLIDLLSQQPDESQLTWPQVATMVFSLLVAIGGWVFALIQASQSRKEAAKRQERDIKEAGYSRLEEHLFRSLEFFSGKTQRRSIGIAVVSANWEKYEHLRPTWVSVLVSQAIYLLNESEQYEKTHELQNLKDIINILLKPNSDISIDDKVALRKAIQDNRSNKEDKDKNGIKIVDPKDLDRWEENFK